MRSTKAAKRVSAAAKKALKETRNKIINDICVKMHEAKNKNKGRLPDKFLSDLLMEIGTVCPGITRDIVNYNYKIWAKRQVIALPAQQSADDPHGKEEPTVCWLAEAKAADQKGPPNNTNKIQIRQSLLPKTKSLLCIWKKKVNKKKETG